MTTLGLIDPELRPFLNVMPTFTFTHDALPEIRAQLDSQTRLWSIDDQSTCGPEVRTVAGRAGDPPVPLYIYRPSGGVRPGRGAILHIHGGAMVIGSARTAVGQLPALAESLGVVAVSVDYRLAPETPFPGPQEDCYAALVWLASAADELGFDPERIVVMGESAGGGLAAALAQMDRDRGGNRLAGQILIYPMLDHRTGGPKCVWRNPTAGEFGFTAASNQFGWACLRGDYDPVDDRKGWFAPALADDLAGLPPAFVSVAALDVLADEDIDYARRLNAAGVPAELHVYPGAFHGFDLMREARLSRQARHDLEQALDRML